MFPVKENSFANCGSMKVFSSKFLSLMAKRVCIPPFKWLRGLEYCSSAGLIYLWLWTDKGNQVMWSFTFCALPGSGGGIATCVCIGVTDAASINHKQFQENILKTYCFLGDLLHLQHHTSDPAAYRIWLSAIRAEYLNTVTT